MDFSWHRHPPPPPPPPGGAPQHGTICPVCSVSHFPFCSPPFPHNHPIHQYPPPPQPDQFYPRPPPPPPPAQPTPPASAYDPFVGHPSTLGMNPWPLPADPQRPWSGGSGFDRDPYGNLYPGFDCSNVGAKRMASDDSGNIGAKRIRSDDYYFSTGLPDPYVNENFVNSSSFSSENERRLKLVRDHGSVMSYEADRNLDAKTGMGFKASNNLEAGYGNFDRKHTYFDQENHLNVQKHGEEKFGLLTNQADTGSHHKYGYSMHPTDSYNNTKQPRESHQSMGYSWQAVSGSSAGYNDHKGVSPVESRDVYDQFSQSYTMQHHMESKLPQYGSSYLKRPGNGLLNQGELNNGLRQDSRLSCGRPPLPASPPPPLPMEPPGPYSSDPLVSTGTSASLFPTPVASSAVAPSSYAPRSEASSLPLASYPNKGYPHASTGVGSEEFQANWQAPPRIYLGGGNEVGPLHSLSPEKPKIVDASHIIKHPHRATRPDHIVIILRGLPGSGKSYLAKMLRDLEVENGGSVPRIHSMDDYFMTEVEKIEESAVSKSSGSVRGKKQVTKKVIEYFYEPEMEEAYRSSMLKAFKKTLDEAVFPFIIVDDRNLRVADFAQFWATAKRSGYEVYLLEATYKDPVGCAARNVHGFSQDDIQKMADLWEEAPSLYLKLDMKSLLHGDRLEESGIQEVDMDMEDGDPVGGVSVSEETNIEKVVVPHAGELASDGHSKGDQRWDAEGDHPAENVKDLGKSKWSNNFDEDDIHRNEKSKGNLNALSGLTKSYSKEGKSVRWGDEVSNSGFSIAAAKTSNIFSLVIGPGAGYNLKSNPLSEEEKPSSSNMDRSKKRNVFHERLRAERESFRAVFDKRRHRIGGLAVEDD